VLICKKKKRLTRAPRGGTSRMSWREMIFDQKKRQVMRERKGEMRGGDENKRSCYKVLTGRVSRKPFGEEVEIRVPAAEEGKTSNVPGTRRFHKDTRQMFQAFRKRLQMAT